MGAKKEQSKDPFVFSAAKFDGLAPGQKLRYLRVAFAQLRITRAKELASLVQETTKRSHEAIAKNRALRKLARNLCNPEVKVAEMLRVGTIEKHERLGSN